MQGSSSVTPWNTFKPQEQATGRIFRFRDRHKLWEAAKTPQKTLCRPTPLEGLQGGVRDTSSRTFCRFGSQACHVATCCALGGFMVACLASRFGLCALACAGLRWLGGCPFTLSRSWPQSLLRSLQDAFTQTFLMQSLSNMWLLGRTGLPKASPQDCFQTVRVRILHGAMSA